MSYNMGGKNYILSLDHVDKFKQILKDAEMIVVSDAGHSPFIEKTAMVYQKLLIFLIEGISVEECNNSEKLDGTITLNLLKKRNAVFKTF